MHTQKCGYCCWMSNVGRVSLSSTPEDSDESSPKTHRFSCRCSEEKLECIHEVDAPYVMGEVARHNTSTETTQGEITHEFLLMLCIVFFCNK